MKIDLIINYCIMAESVACNFINTPVYEAIASWIETASLPIVLLGAKGVGKTTTLIMLHESCKRPKHYFDLSSDHDVVRLSEKLKTISPLSGNEEKEYPVWLFVDNIHEMVNYTCLNDLIRMYVKGWTQYRNRGRLVCAVSRYGLVGLLKKFRINYSDLNTQVVNPTEEVAWSLLRRVCCGTNV
ncbi:uncharacterized protein LOC114544366 isoform X1 [Dendronephthya gigantea]|uniref:uncharacterized protein LOC114531166 isoform X1 n=1 Tax=Dendronephthya gigantea TaxID=151771 RepID=UPI0010693D56|nr:uncharacterized protein LOC114531166 isoform X1 [Dendronephthya gigantea]XP_028418820.1 uncharacterized protein LOC114544366 isoform X1 [Dendronephthya gigantea]